MASVGETVVITGAGHGIGRGHALELAKHGASVVVNDLGTSVRGEGSGRDAERGAAHEGRTAADREQLLRLNAAEPLPASAGRNDRCHVHETKP